MLDFALSGDGLSFLTMSRTSRLEVHFALYAAFIKYSAKIHIFVQTTNFERNDGAVGSLSLAEHGMRGNAAATPTNSSHVRRSFGQARKSSVA